MFCNSFTFCTKLFLIVSIPNVVPFVASSVCISNTHILNSSSYCAISVLFFALFAFPNIPFSPITMFSVTPARINNTIMVITKATNVIAVFEVGNLMLDF